MRRVITTLGARLFRTQTFAFSTIKQQTLSIPFVKVQSSGMWRPLKYNFSSGNKESITMPALSPTMNSGKIVKWTKKVGDKVNAGDLLCEVETDKATVDFETNSEGYLAKIVKGEGESADVGEEVAVIVEDQADIKSVGEASSTKKQSKPAKQEKKQEKPSKEEKTEKKEKKQEKKPEQETQEKEQTTSKPTKQASKSQSSGDRIIASPLAKVVAGEKNIDLQGVKGSGPNGRIIEQDVQAVSQKSKPAAKQETSQSKKSEASTQQKAGKFVAPQNPYLEIPITGMRKTIASRLIESKTTIPHYYISVDVTTDNIDQLRSTINANESENGVKITVNDFILKAAALALRDFPTVNVQWGEKSIKQFQYCDVSMAVSTESGLITPIIYRAETKGLIQIAKQAKELAKKARDNKLQPSEFVGGTISVSNAGMYGLSQMISVINPPQAIILGVAKAQKKILFDDKASDPQKPYKVANVMAVWASVDHRLVDGALAAQYLGRVKKYLQTPVNMIL